MAHRILTDDPAAVAFRAEHNRLEADRKKAVADAEQKQLVYNESNSRALAEGTPLPASAPQTPNQVNQAYGMRGAEIDRREQAWLAAELDRLVADLHAQADQVMVTFAGLADQCDAARAELQGIYSALLHIAHRTNTARPTVAPVWDVPALLQMSRSGRPPLRYDETPATAQRAEPPRSLITESVWKQVG